MWLRTQHPRIHLIFVPANCTSKLQPADVGLQRPFKSHIRNEFNAWAAAQLKQQIDAGPDSVLGLTDSFRMAAIKPLVLQWCVDSWQRLNSDKSFTAQAWYRSVLTLYDICDPEKRCEALAAVARKELDTYAVPEGVETNPAADSESEHESDEDDDSLDVAQAVRIGERRSARASNPPPRSGYMLDSQYIQQTDDDA